MQTVKPTILYVDIKLNIILQKNLKYFLPKFKFVVVLNDITPDFLIFYEVKYPEPLK